MSPRTDISILRSAVVAGAALVALLLLPAVAAGAGVAVTGADNGKTVIVIPNTTVTITLESNASTGYSWEVLTPPSASIAGLLPGAGTYTAPPPPASGPPLVGAPGWQTFAFRSRALGTTKIVLGYIPPGGSTPGQTFALDIRVVTPGELPNTSTSTGPGRGAPPVALLVGLLVVVLAAERLLARRVPR